MKAHATDQWRLLDVQALDTRLAQLEHRRRNLPEAVRLAGNRTPTSVTNDTAPGARSSWRYTISEPANREMCPEPCSISAAGTISRAPSLTSGCCVVYAFAMAYAASPRP